jgi:RND family efflux transporter MFP subunit
VGAIIILVLLAIGFIPKYLNNKSLSENATAVTTTPPEVEVVSAKFKTPNQLDLPGNIEAITTTSVQARSNGYVTKLYADIGTHVHAGQILADVQSPDLDQQLVQASSQTAQARATVTQSESEVQRLLAAQAQSVADLSHQKAAVIQAEAALDTAEAQRSQAEANLLVAKAALLRSNQQVKVQQAALNQAEAQYALATANVKRYTELLKEGFVAQQDFDTAEATYRTQGAAIASAKANVASAEADVRSAQETIKSNEDLVKAADGNINSAKANIKAAQANVTSSEAGLDAAKKSVTSGRYAVKANQATVGANLANENRYGVLQSFEHIVAPFDGVITVRNVDVGSLVAPGNTSPSDGSTSVPSSGLFGIARSDTLRIFVNIPQTNFALARVGTPVKISVREVPNQVFTGLIHQTAGAINEVTRTVQTEIRIPNPTGLLLPGMYAMIHISAGSQKELRVPSEALIFDAQGTRVMVVGPDGKLEGRKLVLGRDYGTEEQVVSGITDKDKLVSNPTDDLQDGMKVTVTEMAPDANAAAPAATTGGGKKS